MHLGKMRLSTFASLGKFSRFSDTICNWKCSLRRHSTQSIGTDARRLKRWTAEENRKLEDLFKQGLKLSDIVNEMKGRTYVAIVKRLKDLRMGLTRGDDKSRNNRPWSVEEEALMFEKLEQGLKTKHMTSFFPERTYASVSMHINHLRLRSIGQQDTPKYNSDPRIQRIVDMRVKEAKGLHEIASELGIKHSQVKHLWESQCKKTLSKEMRDQVYLHNNWSPREIEHLYELHRRGTLGTRDAALQFPSKTLLAVKAKASAMQLRFPVRFKKREVSVPIKSEE